MIKKYGGLALVVVVLCLIALYVINRNFDPGIERSDLPKIAAFDENKSTAQSDELGNYESDREKMIKSAKKLNVVFRDATPLAFEDIFSDKFKEYYAQFGEKFSSNNFNFYLIGKVSDGEYKDADVILLTTPPDGPSPYKYFNYLLKLDSTYYFLSLNSDNTFQHDFTDPQTGQSGQVPNFKDNVRGIEDQAITLTPPALIKDKDGSEYRREEYINALFDSKGLDIAFIHETLGNVYYKKVSNQYQDAETRTLYDDGGFFVKGPGGILYVYEALDPKKVGQLVNEKPVVTFNDPNIKIDSNYKYTDIGGCGSINYVSLPQVSDSELQVVGKANIDGGNIYILKDKNHHILKDLYYLVGQEYGSDGLVPKYSYEEFLSKVPVFFWKDKFGRLIKFQSESFVPFAECGKPVIYLYPKTTTDVSVKVMPKGGFTKTIPDYNGGWNVVATPESVITDKSTGIEYPYLFWEGRGGIYETPKKGWVIKEDDVKSFLNEKLGQLGLIQKEKNDFMEFWLPKMSGSPYYFITFLGNREMDNIAPLQIVPKPDSVIRILMDFTPLKEKIDATPFTIKTPERNGFTAVEWGGVLR